MWCSMTNTGLAREGENTEQVECISVLPTVPRSAALMTPTGRGRYPESLPCSIIKTPCLATAGGRRSEFEGSRRNLGSAEGLI